MAILLNLVKSTSETRIICEMSSVYTILASGLSAGTLRPAESGAVGRAIREKHVTCC